MKHISFCFVIITLLTIAFAPLSQAADMSVKETPLTTIKEYLGTLDGVGETLLLSPDCQHIALVVKQSEEMGWQIDGETQKYFPEIGPGQWSPDSKHFAYTAPDGNNWRLLIDGKGGSSFDKVGFPVWSPDSSKLSYVAQQKDNFIIVNDNKKSQPFEAVRDLQYSANGASLAAIVKKDGKDYLWIDGQLTSSAMQIDQFAWSTQGSHYVYAASDGTSWRVFHDGTPGKAVESVQLLTISPDGLHVAYVATIASGYVVRPGTQNTSNISAKTQLLIADEKTLDSQMHAGFVYTGIVYSPDSQHLAWTAGYFGQVVVPNATPDLPNVVASGMHVYRDGESGPGYTNVSAPVWSSDSLHLAYGTVQISGANITKYIVTDDTPSEAYYDVTQPVWNPSNNQLAYAAVPISSKDKSVVFNNGKSGGEYDTATDLRFSADGKYFSYLALGGKGAFAMINGVQSPTYDGFLGNAKSYLDAAGHLHAVALKDENKVLHVEFAVK